MCLMGSLLALTAIPTITEYHTFIKGTFMNLACRCAVRGGIGEVAILYGAGKWETVASARLA